MIIQPNQAPPHGWRFNWILLLKVFLTMMVRLHITLNVATTTVQMCVTRLMFEGEHAQLNVMNSLLREEEIVMQQYVWCLTINHKRELGPISQTFQGFRRMCVSNSLMWLFLPQYMLIQPMSPPSWSSSGIRAMVRRNGRCERFWHLRERCFNVSNVSRSLTFDGSVEVEQHMNYIYMNYIKVS